LNNLAPPLERVISELCKLPSIGRKTAQRLAFHLLKAPEEDARALARAIGELRSLIRFCRDCFNLSDAELCPVCTDTRRDRSVLCIVEEASNLIAIERTGSFKGLYHVLGGALSPLKDVGPEQLHTRELMERLGSSEFEEVILATNPDVEGEATAVYLSRLIQPLGLRITRLAQGLPAGSDLEYTDDLTLTRALEGRRSY
jgi:recombination protein RecR